MMERPNHAIDGAISGFKSAGRSIMSGVTGVYSKPIEGAKKSGVGGFLTGVGKGIVGLFAKPISGTLDFVSQTADGIKNTPKHLLDERAAQVTRMRLPRTFYTKDCLFKVYSDMHSFIN